MNQQVLHCDYCYAEIHNDDCHYHHEIPGKVFCSDERADAYWWDWLDASESWDSY